VRESRSINSKRRFPEKFKILNYSVDLFKILNDIVPVTINRHQNDTIEANTRKGLSQSEIGQKLGVTRSYLNRVINGRLRSKRLMRKLRPYLGNPKRKNQYS
jgi:ribosome-binding protein aMBF1 (putative translation factor)